MPRHVIPADSIGSLSDVDLTAIADGDALVWVAANSRLEPGEVSGGGGGSGSGAVGATYSETVGDTSEVTFDITHNLATKAITVTAWEVSSGDQLDPASVILGDNSVRVVFPEAPGTDDALIVIHGGSFGDLEMVQVQVGEVIVGVGGQATIEFDETVIPSDGVDLLLTGLVRTDNAADIEAVNVQFGTSGTVDTANNYEQDSRDDAGNTQSTAVGHLRIGRFAFPGATGQAGAFAAFTLRVPAYRAAINKSIEGSSGFAGTGARHGRGYGQWKNTNPIDVVRLTCNGASDFVEGTVVRLYATVPRPVAASEVEAASTPIYHAMARKTDGDVTANGAFAAIDTALDLELTAAEGDYVEIVCNGMWDSAANYGRIEVYTLDGTDTQVSRFGGTSNGIPGYLAPSSDAGGGITGFGGAIGIVLGAGDIVAGKVKLRVYCGTNTGDHSLRASTGDPFVFAAKNFGPMEAQA